MQHVNSSIRFKIPTRENNDRYGFAWLLRLAADSLLLIRENVELDFAGCTFFAGHLWAALRGIFGNSKLPSTP